MADVFGRLLAIAVPVFAVASMLSIGFGYSVRDVLGPLRDAGGVTTTILANFVMVPLVAFIVVGQIPLEDAVAIGLILVATGAGAPSLIKLAGMARDDVAFAAATLVLLTAVTIIYMPIVVPLLFPHARTSAMAIATPLILTMLLPIALAFAVKAFLPNVAARFSRPMARISTIALLAVVATTIVPNVRAILSLGGRAILAAFLVIGGAFVIGALAGTFDRRERVVLGFGTAQRNFAAAIVVARESFENERVLLMVVLASIMAMVVLLPSAQMLGRHRDRRTERS
jgi:bile acid:Na+ symporter, BASS family